MSGRLTLLLMLAAAGVAGDAPADRIRTLAAGVQLGVQDRQLLQASAPKLFEKDDPLLPPVVRGALDRPLEVAGDAERAAGKIARTKRLSATLKKLADYHRPAPTLENPNVRTKLDVENELDGAVWAAVEAIHGAVLRAGQRVERALARLDEEERAHLVKTLPLWIQRTKRDEAEQLRKGAEDVASREALLRCRELWKKVDAQLLRSAWVGLVEQIEPYVDRLARQKDFRKAIRFDAPAGPVLLRGHGNDGGNADAVLLIDFGGDDEYRLPEDAPRRPVRVVLDLAGDDLYLSRAPFSWGGALLGLSLHVDVKGNDDYRAPDWSLGCGVGGHGALWDLDGRDRYYGGLGSQAVGVFGTGVLRDDGGDDEYAAACFCQGFGSTAGLGALLDRSGDDTYLAGRDEEDIWRRPATYITFAQGSSFSHRFGHVYNDETGARRWKMTGQVAGGVGLLFDAGGDDRYEADVFGQGAAYWYSLALLVDGSGNDRYRTTWYGQGVGTHAAVGCVVDVKGNDWYFSRNTSQGCGHDFSVGILCDRAGDDIYRGVTLCQGAGNESSGLGVLIDETGDDSYRCGGNCWGYGSPKARYKDALPYGFFLDLGGANRYEGPAGVAKAGGTWRQGERGYGVDGR